MSETSVMSRIISAILVIAVVIVALFLIRYFYDFGKKGFSNKEEVSQQENQNIKEVVLIGFIQDYLACKTATNTPCACKLKNSFIPDKFVVEISNAADTTFIRVLKARVIYSVLTLRSLPSIEPLEGQSSIESVKEENVKNDVLLIQDSTLLSPKVKDSALAKSDFVNADKIYISKNNLFFTKDITGKQSIDFSAGGLYKFNDKETAIVPNTQGLIQCNPADGQAVYVFKQFIDELKSSCSAKDLENPKQCFKQEVKQVPGHSIKITKDKITLVYNDKEVTSFSGTFCLLNNPSILDKVNSREIGELSLTDYFSVDYYIFKDGSICLYPEALSNLKAIK